MRPGGLDPYRAQSPMHDPDVERELRREASRGMVQKAILLFGVCTLLVLLLFVLSLAASLL
jgi:hypothetical protein